MAIMRWQPWQEIDTLRRQFDQLFDELAPISRGTATKPNGNGWMPAIELKSTDTDVILRAELPGIDAKDLDVQVSREAVALKGEYKTESKTEDKEHQIFRSEFRYGSFQRVIPLPVAVENDQVKADFKDGILTLTMPRIETERPKVVKVNVGGTLPAEDSNGKG